MRRAPRQTIRRGNLSGKQRRRLASLLRAVRGPYPPIFVYRFHQPGQYRDARRLHAAGLCAVVASRPSWKLDGTPRELALYATREDALRRYPKWALMREKR